MHEILQITDLSTGYKQSGTNKIVTSNINVSLKKGELVCLLGPNGAGKSTLMRTISGEQKPIAGKVVLDDQNIHVLSAKQLAKKLSLVLTERVQAGILTAYEVVSMGRYPHVSWTGKLKKSDHEIIQWSLNMTGATDLAGRVLAELSDGERQKILVARALAQEPELMILDEVTAFLDLPRRVEIMHLLRKLAYESKKAVLLSTHDLDLALRNADRIWLIPKGGELIEGAPEDLVLTGAFEQAFSSEGVIFNNFDGSFHFSQLNKKPIQLEGKGDIGTWTRRALERNGFELQPRAALKVMAISENGKTKWNLTNGGVSSEHKTIYDLINGINRIEKNETKK